MRYRGYRNFAFAELNPDLNPSRMGSYQRAARVAAPSTRIAAVFPDGPHRYFDTIYNDAYCAEHGLLDVDLAGQRVARSDRTAS